MFYSKHMCYMDTTIRNIDPLIYKKLKTKAAQEGITIGEAVKGDQ